MTHSHQVQQHSYWLHSFWMVLVLLLVMSFSSRQSVPPSDTPISIEYATLFSPSIESVDDVDLDMLSFESYTDKCRCVDLVYSGLKPHPLVYVRSHTAIRAPPAWHRSA